jgi:transcriptional regulator with XRE-family HTH domain
MSQTQNLIATLKRLLKAEGITYARVATHLALSEATVKRQFSLQSFSLQTLEAICDLLHIELAELVQAAARNQPALHKLSTAQEKELVADPGRLLTAVCVLNHWSAARIVETYKISQAQCVAYLVQLDRLGLIHLMPENRVKLRIARDFAWLPDGPIQHFFQDRIQSDFLSGSFDRPGQQLRFHHAMLTAEASARLQQRMQRLLREFAELHEDSKNAPDAQRYGTSLLMAVKPWEPQVFETLRRHPDARPFAGAAG